jgi:triosephosphate isomerase
MSRRPIVAANWKMNKTPRETASFLETFFPTLAPDVAAACETVVVPPFTSIPAAAWAVSEAGRSDLGVGAQNLHPEPNGAYTGEVAAAFLSELRVSHVVLGHSERRQYFAETDAFINRKVLAALGAGFVPILCIGETLEERDAGRLEEVCRTQLRGGLAGVDPAQAYRVVIAYEPVWAIGTGRTATPAQAQEAHAFVRGVLLDLFGAETAQRIRIQYGGSMKPDNSAELMAQPDVDGGLIGGASLQPESFLSIVKAAAASVS